MASALRYASVSVPFKHLKHTKASPKPYCSWDFVLNAQVMCVEGKQRGFEWSKSGPWTGCIAGGRRSVVVMVSDSCPCNHPNPSNSRWCCGQPHLDLSWLAFKQIGTVSVWKRYYLSMHFPHSIHSCAASLSAYLASSLVLIQAKLTRASSM